MRCYNDRLCHNNQDGNEFELTAAVKRKDVFNIAPLTYIKKRNIIL